LNSISSSNRMFGIKINKRISKPLSLSVGFMASRCRLFLIVRSTSHRGRVRAALLNCPAKYGSLFSGYPQSISLSPLRIRSGGTAYSSLRWAITHVSTCLHRRPLSTTVVDCAAAGVSRPVGVRTFAICVPPNGPAPAQRRGSQVANVSLTTQSYDNLRANPILAPVLMVEMSAEQYHAEIRDRILGHYIIN
jgi:hypothetical protein